MKHLIFKDEFFSSLCSRMDGALEMLEAQYKIVAVSTLFEGDAYVGVIFYRLKH